MDPKELPDYIVEQLSHGTAPSDLILDICQKNDLEWSEAASLVEQVKAEKGLEIERNRFPLMFFLALAFFLGGIGMVVIGSFGIYSNIDMIRVSIASKSEVMPTVNLISRIYVVLFALYQVAAGYFLFFFLGSGMVLGGLIGMRDAWAAVLPG